MKNQITKDFMQLGIIFISPKPNNTKQYIVKNHTYVINYKARKVQYSG